MTQVTSSAFAAIDREGIWAALFAWFQQQLGGSFRCMGRKHVLPPRLQPADQPAFFQVAVKEKHMPVPGLPAKLQLRGYLIVYVYDDSPEEVIGQEQLLAETTLNNLLMQIDAALVPDNPSTNKFTLGGQVTHCWIEGESDIDPGIFGSQCAAILPINILA